jgi:hypothetical protein
MPGGRLTNHPAGFADVRFVTMAVPVEHRLITLTASSRSTGTLLPPSFLTDVRKTARDRLWVEAAQLGPCHGWTRCKGWVRHMTTSMWHNQDRYLPGCRLAPPVPKSDTRTALTCALKHAVHLSRYERLKGLDPGVRRFASSMHGQTLGQLTRMWQR